MFLATGECFVESECSGKKAEAVGCITSRSERSKCGRFVVVLEQTVPINQWSDSLSYHVQCVEDWFFMEGTMQAAPVYQMIYTVGCTRSAISVTLIES